MDQKASEPANDPDKIQLEDNQGLPSPLAKAQCTRAARVNERRPAVPVLRRGENVPIGMTPPSAQPFMLQTMLLLSHMISQVTQTYEEYDHADGPVLQYRGCVKYLMDILCRRKMLTVTELRNFFKYFLQACRYLQEQQVTLQDLKLSNLFLEKSVELIGDFGLATRMAYDGQREEAFCRTPNYVACEIFGHLGCTGPSFEIDVWAIGWQCFTLLVGRPPFESSTYRENAYSMPSAVTSHALNFFRHLLHLDPQRRSRIEAILKDEFFRFVSLPPRLPTSCLTTRTHLDMTNASSTANRQRQRQLTATALSKPNEDMEPQDTPTKNCSGIDTKKTQWKEPQTLALPGGAQSAAEIAMPKIAVVELKLLLHNLCDARPPVMDMKSLQAQEDPSLTPVFWINKWVDYADRYGIGYQLCDTSIGVLFNDDSRVALDMVSGKLMHTDKNGLQIQCSLEEYPQSLAKKIILIKHFSNYMDERLLAVGEDPRPRQCDIDTQPFVMKWIRSSSTMSFYLSNGTFQLNCKDHTKVIICPLLGAVSYIDRKRVFHTYRLQSLHYGCPPELFCRLKYARKVVDQLDSTSA